MWLILIIIAIIVVCGIVSMKRDEQAAQQQQEQTAKYELSLSEEYKNALQNLNGALNEGQIIENSPQITCINYERPYDDDPSFFWITSLNHYAWLKNETLYLFPTFGGKMFHTNRSEHQSRYGLESSDLILKSIPIDKIMFYRQIGSVYTTTTGSGGESTFSPITGFHGKINPIKIESHVHDERTTQLFYDDGIKDQVMIFEDKDYYVLRKLLPQKDYQVVTISEATNNQSGDEYQRLEKLNKLYKSGLISDEDYQKKKDDILSDI